MAEADDSEHAEAAEGLGCDELPGMAKLRAEEATIRHDVDCIAAMVVVTPFAQALLQTQREWCCSRLAEIRAEMAAIGAGSWS